MIFDLTAKKLISYDQEKSSENLRENFVAFIQGLISFPFDIPGTAYHKCLRVNHLHYAKICLDHALLLPGMIELKKTLSVSKSFRCTIKYMFIIFLGPLIACTG